MKGSVSVAAAGLALVQLSSANGVMPRQDTCPTLYNIVARGSTEGQGVPGTPNAGQGAISAVTAIIDQAIPGSSSIGLTYPATLSDYTNSEYQGVGNLTQLLESFTAKCPTSKIALLGFSQGGQVIADTLCGGTEQSFIMSDPIPLQYTKNVIAAVTFGDPSHVFTFFGNRGNYTKNGVFPRENIANCDPYMGRYAAYCQAGDTFCDHGNSSDSLLIHVREVLTYGDDAAAYVISQYKNSMSTTPSTSTTSLAPVTTAATTSTKAPVINATATSKPGNVSAPTSVITATPPIFTAGATARAVGVQIMVGVAALAVFALL